MSRSKPLIIALIGPTASGKTELGIEIAQKLDLEIHNIDSRQIYMDMDIGTAKPTKAQQQKIRHFLIDLQPPNQQITMHEFKSIAMKSIERGLKKKQIGLLVGGSGLYLKAITRGLCPPAIPAQLSFRKQLKELGQKECHQLLKHCDPISAKSISVSDYPRIIRALEVFYASGQSIHSLRKFHPPEWDIIEIGLNPSNLHERINKRTHSLFDCGLIEETQNLISKYGSTLPLLKTIGYEEASQLINGKIGLDQAITQINQRTNQFAKRQRTWFRGQHDPKWLNEKNPLCEALSLIHNVIG
ncbi:MULTISPECIES: tRNA (adenosine(37)-N6)-dimethylallyltransferase MiaA [Prochlorococcus]|uniref:tRNA (adenosine(37)-N6)-dimethylallyltransferase MiaA n=1 Tax=Prochlorococcus TaxID=1218 RepID=UPI0005645D18|nr:MULTISPECIES: tRNA (adenosine(37)-N6)-dimethylallyltransferase MiaA [Prochlorococcus]